ncbi:Ig-like domain-containing protein [Variovorax sp. EBFNA2]|uniref:Ig-like domain-containing protein n=1 Tax=Variovorax sp. EBFNA2 TaxID=3342097 RepID=UPI0029BFC35C|nr:Ig-like domain-containing protein [Variovorax boronicumulans]WPG35934.1 Ig-like domain-containing protein [Variovorax boronicumulans]
MASENTNVVADDKNIDHAMRTGASTYAPLPPAAGGVLDNAGDIQNALASGSITDDRQPEFRGQGTPGDTIVIKDNGTEIDRAEVDDNGQWSFTPSTDLIEGHHAITLVARDTAGNLSEPSAPFNFEIDVTPPDASKLAITNVMDAVGAVTGHVSSGGTTDDARPLLSGISSGVPGHTVVVMVRNSTGTHALGEAVIGENGNWTFQVDTPLAAGQNTFMLVETDTAGNETVPTDRYHVSVNTDKPTPPVIESVFDDVGAPHMLQPGETTNDTKPTLSGTAQANHTVKFYDGSTYLGETVADANGQWTFTPKSALTDGAHGITATSSSPLGQTSGASDAWNFVIDTTPPTQTAELIDIGKDSGFSADDYLTNDGSAGRLLHGNLSAPLTAGDTLQVSTDDGKTWTTAFLADGKWSAQDDNSHTGDWTVQMRVVDEAGNAGAVESQAMTLDTVAPGAPTKVSVVNGGVQVEFNPADVAVGHKLSLILRGDHFDYALTAADIAAGKVFFADPTQTTVDFEGFPVNGPFLPSMTFGDLTIFNPDGLQLRNDAEGHGTVGLEGSYLYAYASRPVPPITFQFATGKEAFSFRIADQNTGGVVKVYDVAGKQIGSVSYPAATYAAQYADVSFTAPSGLTIGKFIVECDYDPGGYLVDNVNFGSAQLTQSDISVAIVDPAGNTSDYKDSSSLNAPAQAQTLTDASAGTLHGGSDNNVFTVTDVKHLADSAIAGNGGLDTLKLTGANQTLDLTGLGHKVSSIETVDITGTGNNTLNLSLGDVMENGAVDQFVTNGRVQMMVKGNAGDAVSLTDLLPNGTDPGDWVKGANVTIDGVVYEVYAHSGFKADLLVQQGVTVTLQITIDRVMDDAGAITGAIDKGGFTDDATPTLHGKAAAGGTVKIYDGSTLLGSAVADASGSWSYTPGTALRDGLYSLSATVTPVGGSESARTAVFNLTVDTQAPFAPVIVSVYDDQGALTGNLINGTTTDDARPEFKGKAEAGSTVNVYDGSTLLGSTVADAGGNWAYTPGTALSDGAHSVTITATDKAGNTGAPSDAFSFTLAVAPTQTATVTSIGKDSGFKDNDFLTNDGSAGRLIQGILSEPLANGQSVQISTDGGKTWSAVVIQENGGWWFVDPHSHTDEWEIQTRVTGSNGAENLSVQIVDMDDVAPMAPTSVVANGAQITVTFDGSTASFGDRIYLINGTYRFEYTLTEVDISAGQIIINPPIDFLIGYSVGMVDAAGNSSELLKSFPIKLTEDFDTDSLLQFRDVGDTIDTGALLLTKKEFGPYKSIADGISENAWAATRLPGWGISGVTNASLKGMQAESIEFDWKDSQSIQTIIFYDINEIEIFRKTFGGGTPEQNLHGHSKFTMPAGKSFASFDVKLGPFPNQPSDWILIDNIQINSTQPSTSTHAIADIQIIGVDSDSYYGGASSNVFSLAAVSYLSGRTAINGNGGVDTLKLTGANQTLDLTALAGKVSSVEIIDITGTGNNTLKLSLAEVMENGAKDQFVTDGRVQMMVKGNAGDKVTLSDALPNGIDLGDWVKGANVAISGVVYEVYAHSGFGAELLVQQGVTVTLQNNAGAGTFHINPEAEAFVLDHATQAHTDSDDQIIAKLGFADRLEGGAGNDTFTTVGTADVVHGGSGNDTIRINSGDFERIDGGLGIDTLVMDGKSMHIDLSALGMKVQGFEKFDLGAGGNTLALSASDVLAGGVRDMVTADGKVQMLVNGANGDVDLLGGSDAWTQGSNTTVGDVTYSVYTNLAGTAELLVEDKVHVTIL